MKKGLIASFMVALMLVTVLSAVVTANVVNVRKEKTEKNSITVNDNYGYILCEAQWYNEFTNENEQFTMARLKCKDLSTGEERLGRTNTFGKHRFILLPRGHDYKIYEDMRWFTAPEVIIENLGYKGYAYFLLTPMHSININERNIYDNSKTFDNPFILERFPLLNLLLQRLKTFEINLPYVT